MSIMLITFSTFLISSGLMFLSFMISKKTINWREKWSPFECGFNPFSSSRIPFSMRFFLIAIIFIIFDVEIALLIPVIPSFLKSSIMKWFFTTTFFMFIIILGTLIEWKEMSFEWKE